MRPGSRQFAAAAATAGRETASAVARVDGQPVRIHVYLPILWPSFFFATYSLSLFLSRFISFSYIAAVSYSRVNLCLCVCCVARGRLIRAPGPPRLDRNSTQVYIQVTSADLVMNRIEMVVSSKFSIYFYTQPFHYLCSISKITVNFIFQNNIVYITMCRVFV